MFNLGSDISTKKINSLMYRINQVAIIFMCMWFAIPYFRFRAGVLFLLVLFIIWLTTTDLKWLTKKITLDLIFILCFFVTFLPYIINGNLQYDSLGTSVIIVNFPIFLIGILINHYYMYYKKDYETLGKIALFSLIFFTIGSLQTYFGLLEHPMAARELAGAVDQNPELRQLYNQLGIGGYDHIYSTSFLLIATLYPIIRKSQLYSVKDKALLYIPIISMFIMLLQASYAISLLIVFLGILLILFIRKRLIFFCLLGMSTILLIIIPQTIIAEFLFAIANLFSGNDILYEKFTDLATTLLYGSTEGQTGNRIELYLSSIRTFLSSPLFGVYGPLANLNSGWIGRHSGWLDLLGLYGIFTTIPLFLVFYFNFKKHMRNFKKNSHDYFIIIYFLFVLFGTINPILYIYEIGFVMFCVLPSIHFLPFAYKGKSSYSIRSIKEYINC